MLYSASIFNDVFVYRFTFFAYFYEVLCKGMDLDGQAKGAVHWRAGVR